MTDVLDLIDGAISDWETSPDAMRWSAEPRPQPPILMPPIDTTAIAAAFDRMVTAIRPMMQVWVKAIEEFAAKLGPEFFAYIDKAEKERLRRMHSAYSRRMRARRRRRRHR